MESAEPLYRKNAALLDQPSRLAERFHYILARPEGRPELKLWSTIPASIRLRVKPSVGRIIVFGPARAAHFEGSHRGARAVVRNVADNGEPRTAIRTVDEGVAKTAVARIHHFAQALVADGHVRRNERFRRGIQPARKNAKNRIVSGLGVAWNKRGKPCQGRDLLRQPLEKAFDIFGAALHFNAYARRRIGDETHQIAFIRQAVDKWAKPDALHDAGNLDGFSYNVDASRFCHARIIAKSSGGRSRSFLLYLVGELSGTKPRKTLSSASGQGHVHSRNTFRHGSRRGVCYLLLSHVFSTDQLEAFCQQVYSSPRSGSLFARADSRPHGLESHALRLCLR